MLPKTLTLQSTSKQKREVEVDELGCTDVPDHDGGNYAWAINDKTDWDGHWRDEVKPFLSKWKFPARVQEVRDRTEQALVDGLPDQRRVMLRNQQWGMIDDQYIADLALGEEVDSPFMRWSRVASDEVRVAICLDGTVCCGDGPEKLEARMCVAAGLASALESLGYEVSVLAACALSRFGAGKPRQEHCPVSDTRVLATVLKDEREAMTDSGFAHLADTGLRRLMYCWVTRDNGFATHLTDQEWRVLTEADLLVYIGADDDSHDRQLDVINTEGLPSGARLGPVGEDALRLEVQGPEDVDKSIRKIEDFFGSVCQ